MSDINVESNLSNLSNLFAMSSRARVNYDEDIILFYSLNRLDRLDRLDTVLKSNDKFVSNLSGFIRSRSDRLDTRQDRSSAGTPPPRTRDRTRLPTACGPGRPRIPVSRTARNAGLSRLSGCQNGIQGLPDHAA